MVAAELSRRTPIRLLFILWASLGVLFSGAAANAVACPAPDPPTSCPNCFAVFIMPDTQFYTWALANNTATDKIRANPNTPGGFDYGAAAFSEEGAIHLERVADWVCANKASFVEPSTGKEMPIELFVHLGDLVQHNEYDNSELKFCNPNDPPNTCNSCQGNSCEWNRILRVFDRLDQCGVRYLTAPGNHDWKGFDGVLGLANSIHEANTYQKRFPDTASTGSVPVRAPWTTASRCVAPNNCDPALGRWYLGGGDNAVAESLGGNAIPNMSRDINGDLVGDGPATDQYGRHRVGMVESPEGDRLLFLGLEFSTGLPSSTGVPASIMAASPLIPAIGLNHQGIQPGFPEVGDLVAPNSQVFLILNGHELSVYNTEHPVTLPDGRTYQVPRLVRDHNAGF